MLQVRYIRCSFQGIREPVVTADASPSARRTGVRPRRRCAPRHDAVRREPRRVRQGSPTRRRRLSQWCARLGCAGSTRAPPHAPEDRSRSPGDRSCVVPEGRAAGIGTCSRAQPGHTERMHKMPVPLLGHSPGRVQEQRHQPLRVAPGAVRCLLGGADLDVRVEQRGPRGAGPRRRARRRRHRSRGRAV